MFRIKKTTKNKKKMSVIYPLHSLKINNNILIK